MSLTDQVREAIDSSGVTLYRVAKDAGVNYATLHSFMVHGADMRLSSLDKIAALFEMRLTKPKRLAKR